MCGIVGILRFNRRPVSNQEIEGMTEALAHRGSDSSKIAIGGEDTDMLLGSYPGIGLGHRRLAILDLSNMSAQPMASADQRLWLVYNGELYNYRDLRRELEGFGFKFRTSSDTEVVLASYEFWGEDCLGRFNGMFAFAIWDNSNSTLFCARDPLGIKPFYYSINAGQFRFASESAALIKGSRPELSKLSISCYFMSMYVPRQLSIYENVNKLLPGHSIRVDASGKTAFKCYWSLPNPGVVSSSSHDAQDRLLALLDRAVSSQLQSDVPVGLLLSGGFDSGMIAASAAKSGTKLHTYSVGFMDSHDSELDIARCLSRRYGMIHRERVMSSDEVLPVLERVLRHMSEPVADSAVVPTFVLAEMAANDGVKVLLSGAGGDEVFAGYPRYVASNALRRALYCLPFIARRALGHALSAATLSSARLRHPSIDMLVYAGGSPELAANSLSDDETFNDFLEQITEEVYPREVREISLLSQHMRFDLQVYLPDLLLYVLDQITMLHTVEGRVPLLDLELIRASYEIDSRLHANPTQSKTRRLMRAMADQRLDQRTLSGKKQGFSGPVRSWIEQNMNVFRDRIMDARTIEPLRQMPVETYFTSVDRKRSQYWSSDIFLMFCFVTWYEAHVG